MIDSAPSPQETLQRLLQADRDAQKRARRAEEQAQALVARAREEAQALVEQAREKAQAETGAPGQASTNDAEQPYHTDPDALRQQAEPRLQEAASRLAAWVAGEERSS